MSRYRISVRLWLLHKENTGRVGKGVRNALPIVSKEKFQKVMYVKELKLPDLKAKEILGADDDG